MRKLIDRLSTVIGNRRSNKPNNSIGDNNFRSIDNCSLHELAALENTPVINEENIQAFSDYVDNAIELLKSNQVNELIKVLLSNDGLQIIGYSAQMKMISLSTDAFLEMVSNETEYIKLSNLFALYCGLNIGQKNVKLCHLVLFQGDDISQAIGAGKAWNLYEFNRNTDTDRFKKEAGLVLIEEYLHVLQEIKGNLVDDFVTNDYERDEQEIAIYLRKRGVVMTEIFLSRYDRDQAVKKYFK